MSKMITVQDDTYYLLKMYSQKTNDSISGTVKQAIKFMVDTDKAQGKNLGSDADMLALYNKTFVEKPESDLELFKKKILDYVNKCEDVKGRITNFVSSL